MVWLNSRKYGSVSQSISCMCSEKNRVCVRETSKQVAIHALLLYLLDNCYLSTRAEILDIAIGAPWKRYHSFQLYCTLFGDPSIFGITLSCLVSIINKSKENFAETRKSNAHFILVLISSRILLFSKLGPYYCIIDTA